MIAVSGMADGGSNGLCSMWCEGISYFVTICSKLRHDQFFFFV